MVTTTEAYITLGFFALLLILAYGADKYNASKKEKLEEKEDNERKGRKAQLRQYASLYGELTII